MDLKIYSLERNSAADKVSRLSPKLSLWLPHRTFSLFAGGLLQTTLQEVRYSTDEVLLSPPTHAHSYWHYTVNFTGVLLEEWPFYSCTYFLCVTGGSLQHGGALHGCDHLLRMRTRHRIHRRLPCSQAGPPTNTKQSRRINETNWAIGWRNRLRTLVGHALNIDLKWLSTIKKDFFSLACLALRSTSTTDKFDSFSGFTQNIIYKYVII